MIDWDLFWLIVRWYSFIMSIPSLLPLGYLIVMTIKEYATTPERKVTTVLLTTFILMFCISLLTITSYYHTLVLGTRMQATGRIKNALVATMILYVTYMYIRLRLDNNIGGQEKILYVEDRYEAGGNER